MDEDAVNDWVGRYVHAWETNDPGEIAALFTEDARYYTAPHRDPWTGQDEIVRGWLGRKDDQGDWTFEHEVLALAGPLAFVRGRTSYHSEGTDYSNLWVLRLEPDGRVAEFTEWWMEARG
jgi:ketosteroid isomerase-like protein